MSVLITGVASFQVYEALITCTTTKFGFCRLTWLQLAAVALSIPCQWDCFPTYRYLHRVGSRGGGGGGAKGTEAPPPPILVKKLASFK